MAGCRRGRLRILNSGRVMSVDDGEKEGGMEV